MMLLMLPRLSSEGKAAKHFAYFKDTTTCGIWWVYEGQSGQIKACKV